MSCAGEKLVSDFIEKNDDLIKIPDMTAAFIVNVNGTHYQRQPTIYIFERKFESSKSYE